MRTETVGVALAAWSVALCASAGVVTNHWTNADGGGIMETNAAGQRVNFDAAYLSGTNVMVFPLHDGAQIRNDAGAGKRAGFAGMVFAPADDETHPWPTWSLVNTTGDGFEIYRHSEMDANPLCVTDGTLVLGENMRAFTPQGENDLPLRKEGNGVVRVTRFYNGLQPGYTFEIADGSVIPMDNNALRYVRVKETSDTGHLVFTNTWAVAVGAFEPYRGRTVDAQGNQLVFGSAGTTRFPGSVTNFTKLSAVARTVVVTNLLPGAVYCAQTARLRLDSKTGTAIPFAKYDFEESLTKDSSGHGRDLTANGAVTWIDDATRGGKVAHFSATSNSGGKLELTVTGQTELTGDSDYTVSLWAKTAATPTENNYPTLFCLGYETTDHQLVQFRFKDGTCSRLLLGHWGSPGDYSDIPATSTPTAWHHYVIMRQGDDVGVWIDGERVLRQTSQAFRLALPSTVRITLGKLAPMGRFFAGDLDDVRIYSRALGKEGVESLFKGEEPVEGGALAVAGEPLEIPSDVRLETGLNGEIYLAGTQTLTKVYGDAVRGGVVMPGGGELRMTGPGRYDAGVAGPADFVKTGGGKLTLGGVLTHTGETRVSEGTLALAPQETLPRPVAAWDFEDPDKLGSDALGGAIHVYSWGNGASRAWDGDRQSHVARFTGGANKLLAGECTSMMLSGDSDYTISVWAKPAEDCPVSGTLVSFGQQSDYQEVVFRYNNINSGTVVLSHWGTTYDFADVTTPANPQGAWHHYAATRRGNVFTVYCDGVRTWTKTVSNTRLNLPTAKKFMLGAQLEKTSMTDRIFKGDLDDVRLYGAALTAGDIARLAAGREPTGAEPGASPAVPLPAPVLHYAFEDPAQVGRDSAPGAAHLTKKGTGTFRLVDSPLGGKALLFDVYNQTRLESSVFPAALPANGRPFTVSLWVQTSSVDADTNVGEYNNHYPTFISWGNPTDKTIGYMLAYWPGSMDPHSWRTIRTYLRRNGGTNPHDLNSESNVLGLNLGEADLRWHHYASVYDPNLGLYCYVDGRMVYWKSGAFANDMCSTGGVFYLGAKSTAPGALFRGALDEVKVFDRALDNNQIRAVMRSDMGTPHVLPEGARVTVAADATLDVGGSNESLASLAGEGTLAVDGRVALAGTNTFAGSVIGTGAIALPAGASLTLGSSASAYAGYWDVAPDSELVLPQGVAAVGGTFRPTGVDATTQTAYPGDVELADGLAIAVTEENFGPLVSTAGRVTIRGGGTVTLPTARTTGTWVIARGASVVDAGTGDLSARWRVANADGDTKTRFFVSNGVFRCRVGDIGLALIIR